MTIRVELVSCYRSMLVSHLLLRKHLTDKECVVSLAPSFGKEWSLLLIDKKEKAFWFTV